MQPALRGGHLELCGAAPLVKLCKALTPKLMAACLIPLAAATTPATGS